MKKFFWWYYSIALSVLAAEISAKSSLISAAELRTWRIVLAAVLFLVGYLHLRSWMKAKTRPS